MIQSICHLIASREHGSLERHVADLSRWQAHNTDANITVIAHPRYREMLDSKVAFIPLNTDRNRHQSNVVWRLANKIRTGGFQIAHGHGSKSAQLLAAVKQYTGAIQVITRHSVRHPRDRLASNFAARIAVSAQSIADSRLDWHIIPNGIEHTLPIEQTAKKTECNGGSKVLLLSRLLKPKRVDLVLRAIEKAPQAQLTIAGDGPEKFGLQALSEDLGIQERVQFAGASLPRTALLSDTDVVLLPSPGDDTPYQLAEALLNRCPAICARIGIAEEYVPEDYLLDTQDPVHLAEKIALTLSDTDKLHSAFTEPFDRAAAHLTLDAMARATWNIYAGLLLDSGQQRHN